MNQQQYDEYRLDYARRWNELRTLVKNRRAMPMTVVLKCDPAKLEDLPGNYNDHNPVIMLRY